MIQLAEPPIFTSRTIELFREAIPLEAYEALRLRLDNVKSIFSTFLFAHHPSLTREAYELSTCRYFYPRLEMIVFLLSSLNEVKFADLLKATSDFAFDSLKREGWRLGANAKLLENAWANYKGVASLLLSNLQTLATIQVPPYNFLTSSTKMDFCLSSTLMFLEGEFPNADPYALEFLCKEAQSSTAIIQNLLQRMFSANVVANEERGQTLRSLYGSWADDTELDKILDEIYQSRD